jgi:hypothetical protein
MINKKIEQPGLDFFNALVYVKQFQILHHLQAAFPSEDKSKA